MRNHIAFKFLAILLAAVLLMAALGSALCIITLIGMDLYSSTPEEEYEIQLYTERRSLAVDLVHTYASLKLGNIPEEYYEQTYGYDWKNAYFREGLYFYSIFDENGVMVESTMPDNAPEEAFYEIELANINYRNLAADGTGIYTDDYFDAENDRYVQISYNVENVDDYTVQLYFLDGAYSYDAPWLIMSELYSVRYHLFWVLGASLLSFVAVVIYLCCAAGRKPGSDSVHAGGLNLLPLDIYTAAAVIIEIVLVVLAGHLIPELIYDGTMLLMYLLLLVGCLASLTAVGLIFAWAAQLKTPEHYWLKNTIVGRVIRLILRFLHRIGRGIRWTFRALHSLLRMLPLVWQWLLTAVLMGLVPLIFLLFTDMTCYPWRNLWLFMFLASLAADVMIIIYGAYGFGILMKGARRMSQGDLNVKISVKYLFGGFRDFALHLNALSEAASIAAEKQTRSERMKTELITNVSHDIKTPLTSIINFVDLLQKPHSPEQELEYLEVLSRQSAQMKKLIEDLMELSKASSGNLTVNLQKVDAVEAVNQALGEFSDRLEAAGLTPVFRQPEQPIYITADGRHIWRVLFNLLTNVVKYALPGTRLYVDLMQAENNVVLSLKNVSKAELNISADELMERFVQGDASRKSEGSGLGLNIAKSLMEVQRGQLQLLLDGDLFKVTLVFPAADER